jgi:hypothetical protein
VIAKGWPRTLVINRPGADARRDRLLESWDTKPGYDRDEYPPAVGRGRGAGLAQGADPRGWKADVAYVPFSETAATATCSAPSCGASATAPSSSTSSTRSDVGRHAEAHERSRRGDSPATSPKRLDEARTDFTRFDRSEGSAERE